MYNPMPFEIQKQIADIACATGYEITVIAPVDDPRVEPTAEGTAWVTHYCMIFRRDVVEEVDGFIFKNQFTGRHPFRRIGMNTWMERMVNRLRALALEVRCD